MGKQNKNIANDEAINEQFQESLEDKYGIDPDTNEVTGVKMVHPNRHADRGEGSRRTDTAKRASDKSRSDAVAQSRATTEPKQIADLSKEVIHELSAYSHEICITLYVPARRSSDTSGQSSASLLRNVLQQTSRALALREEKQFETVLEPAYELLKNENFWQSIDAPGIAFFISKDFFKYLILPSAPKEQVQINESFLISPLVSYLSSQDYFYLLVMSKKQSKLFRADQFRIQYIPLTEMPNGIEDVVHLEEKDDQNLFRTGSSGAGGGANYHGIGSGPDEKANIAMYLAEVDATIRQAVLHDQTVPLLLAGVDYLIPIFKKVTHYKNVWDTPITGSHEYDNEQTLYQASLQLLKDHFETGKKKALAQFGNQSATEKTSSTPADVIKAAFYSRVSVLFIRKDAQLWGTFDDHNDNLVVHDEQQAGDENLADKTVLKTILNGGQVYMLEEEEMPTGGQVEAILRY